MNRKSAAIAALVATLALAATGAPAASGPVTPADIAGTYELVKRVLPDGTVIVPPALGGLYTIADGRMNFTVFWHRKNGELVSETTLTRYTLTPVKYCEWIFFRARNNLDRPGINNDVPAVTDHCGPVKQQAGNLVFTPLGEGVEDNFDAKGFQATAKGVFIDYWAKLN